MLFAQVAFAQETEAPAKDNTQSGYDDIKEFGGPESVGTRLKENDEDREADYMFDNLQRGIARHWPISFLVRAALERCGTYQAACAALEQSELIAPTYLTICDLSVRVKAAS